MKSQKQNKILIISARADAGGGPVHISTLTKNLINDFNFYFAVPNDFPYFQKYSNLFGVDRIIEIPHRKFKIHTLLALIKFTNNYDIDIIHSHGQRCRYLFTFDRILYLESISMLFQY